MPSMSPRLFSRLDRVTRLSIHIGIPPSQSARMKSMEPVPSTGIRNIGNEAQNFHALILAFAIKGDAALPFAVRVVQQKFPLMQ